MALNIWDPRHSISCALLIIAQIFAFKNTTHVTAVPAAEPDVLLVVYEAFLDLCHTLLQGRKQRLRYNKIPFPPIFFSHSLSPAHNSSSWNSFINTFRSKLRLVSNGHYCLLISRCATKLTTPTRGAREIKHLFSAGMLDPYLTLCL